MSRVMVFNWVRAAELIGKGRSETLEVRASTEKACYQTRLADWTTIWMQDGPTQKTGIRQEYSTWSAENPPFVGVRHNGLWQAWPCWKWDDHVPWEADEWWPDEALRVLGIETVALTIPSAIPTMKPTGEMTQYGNACCL